MSDPHPLRASSVRALPVVVALLLLASPAVAQRPAASADGNELGCLIDNRGSVCDPQGNGGVWPIGTFDYYIYDAGLQVAGIIGAGAPAAWVGDTIPGFFYDSRGTRLHGSPISDVFSSRRAEDLEAWPHPGDIPAFPFASAFIDAGASFHPSQHGNAAASELDTWTLYWEGNPAFLAQRPHPLGIAVEQRTMQWSAPEGLQSVIFLLYRITNVSDLPDFRSSMAETFFDGDSAAVPPTGWVIDSLFVGFAMDADVTTDASENFTHALPGFDGVAVYQARFVDDGFFEFPPDLFHPPFFGNAPGMVASALLLAEGPGGAAASRITTEMPDGRFTGPATPGEPWRYLSGHLGGCPVPDPIESGWCQQGPSPGDSKHYQSVGPWQLEPGASVTVVFAMVTAPTVATDEVVIGGINPPGLPRRAPGCDGDEILPIERAAGWLATPVCPAPGERLDIASVETVPGSLLHRIQVARAFARSGFLEPQSPEAPVVSLLAGDSAITVFWGRSATETPAGADPYYALASDTSSALYNPNYRAHDVEGYRIYRSTDRANWTELAQLDYDTTTYVDSICETMPLPAGEACAGPREVRITDFDFLLTPLVFYRPGDAVRTTNGNVAILGGDTVSAGHSRLADHVPSFSYVDTDVRAGFRYFYQVRAFDVNSSRSGPASLESSSAERSAIPQRQFSNLVEPQLSMHMEGATGPIPFGNCCSLDVDPDDGTFNGPIPPPDEFDVRFWLEPDVTDLLPATRIEFRIDSVRLGPSEAAPCLEGNNIQGVCWRLFFTRIHDGDASPGFTDGWTPFYAAFGEPTSIEWSVFDYSFEPDSLTADLIELGETFEYRARLTARVGELIDNSAAEGQGVRRRGATYTAGGSRWFAGTEETVADPARFIRVGHLPAIDTVWAPIHHTDIGDGSTYPPLVNVQMQCFGFAGGSIARAADLRVTWQNGTIVVEDVTHGVPVPYRPNVQQSWGFVRDGNGNGMIDWLDFDFVDGVAPLMRVTGFCSDPPLGSETTLDATPTVTDVSTEGVLDDFSATGTGFGLYINGQRFIFDLPGGGLPANGTVWTLRTYFGRLRATDATSADPHDYRYLSGVASAPPFVPGLRFVIEVEEARHLEGAPDLSRVHTVPDPFYYHARFGSDEQGRTLRFVNLPPQATIRIYSVSGVLVDVIRHDDPLGGIATWDLRTRDGAQAASGVYFFHVSTPDGHERVGRFTIVTSWRMQ